MNKNFFGTLVFAMFAMIIGMATIFIVKTAMIHGGLVIAVGFGVTGIAGFMAIAACAYLIHKEGIK